jgi:ABC-type phosphate transport system substrate-binding protein
MSLILIIVKLFDGDPDRGLPVQLEITRIDHHGVAQPSVTSEPKSAPPITSILELQNQCHNLHQDWCRYSNWGGSRIISTQEQSSNYSDQEELEKRHQYKNVNSKLIDQLNQWLEQCLKMVDIDILREINISPNTTPIRLAFETKDHRLQELPWEKCSAFINILANGHRQINTVISPGKHPQHQSWTKPVKVLLILGGNVNINTKKDLELIEEYIPKNAELIIANKRTVEELHDLLWDNSYDIIIFSGHSSINTDGQDGFIDINDVEKRSIDSLSNALSRCVDRGLKILILNSCSGIGLARKLSDNLRSNGKRLPFIVAMRRPILDEIAHSFLKRFLIGFFSKGYSLETAMTEAREFLQQWEDISPGATSLPMLLGARQEAPLFFPVPLPFWKKQLHILQSHLPMNSQLFLERTMKIPPIAFLGLAIAGIIAYQFWPQPLPLAVPTGSYTMASSSTGAIIFNNVGTNIRMKYPNYQLTLDKSPPMSTTHALELLRKEQVNFIQISRLPTDSKGLTSTPLLKSIKAVAVNPKLNFNKDLTLQEIDGICKGNIINWKKLGGEDLPIVLFPTDKPSDGVASTIGDNCQSSNPKNRPVKTPNDALRELFKDENRGGFYVGSASVILNQCQIKVLPINNGGPVDIYKKPWRSGDQCNVNIKNEINLAVVENESYPKALTDIIYLTFREQDTKSKFGAGAYAKYLCTDNNPEKLRQLGFVPICDPK